MSFELLTPDALLGVVETALGTRLTGLTVTLPSYINRVYELRAVDGTKLIAKFYRPGRWERAAIEDEHRFVLDCQEIELPVVAPLTLTNKKTIGQHADMFFAVFPKRSGRQLEISSESDWIRIGSLIARLHLAGEKQTAPHRITIHPQKSTLNDLELLCGSAVPESMRSGLRDVSKRIIDSSAPLFQNTECIRIHGDCHRGNIMDRLDEGLLLIDFDDMAMGPAVQDLWLLLPDRADQSAREIELFLQGYEQFRTFNRASLRCIESLRAMRMIYFLAWCGRQINDFQFRKNFPDWGNDRFWQKEINDLREQLGFILDTL
jgi:Ser/Thr protein kinase RdoA (MazF antagonist)